MLLEHSVNCTSQRICGYPPSLPALITIVSFLRKMANNNYGKWSSLITDISHAAATVTD
jgi:hypothetical protein